MEDPSRMSLVYTGRSMAGTLRPGDLLLLEPAAASEVGVDDVVVYRPPTSSGPPFVVHRVVKKETEGLLVRGDSPGARGTELVTGENLVGRVVRIIRKGGRPFGSLIRIPPPPTGKAWRRFTRRTRDLLRSAARRPYRRLRALPIPAGGSGRLRRVHFHDQNGPLVKYLFMNRTVGTLPPGRAYPRFKKPFVLIFGKGNRPRPKHPL